MTPHNGCYKLIGQTPVACSNLLEWGEWLETADRRVDETFIGKYRVSTVFLGLDHRFGKGKPILFETMIFLADAQRREGESLDDWSKRTNLLNEGDPLVEYQTRSSDWLEAERDHETACLAVEA